MSSDNLNKSLSESSRALAKAFLIWGFETLDKVQDFNAQAQEYIQELVTEAKTEQTAYKDKKQPEKSQPEKPEEPKAEVIERRGEETV